MYVPGGMPPKRVFAGSRGRLRLGYIWFVNQLKRVLSSTPAAAELCRLHGSARGRIL